MTIFEQLQAFTPFNEQEASDRRLMLQYAGLFSDLLTRDNEMAHLTASCWIVKPTGRRFCSRTTIFMIPGHGSADTRTA